MVVCDHIFLCFCGMVFQGIHSADDDVNSVSKEWFLSCDNCIMYESLMMSAKKEEEKYVKMNYKMCC